MRIGVLGGSFNPVHQGHIYIAQAAKERFSLDAMLLMVASVPPHKQLAGAVSGQARWDMASLAAGPAGLIASDLELNRAGQSYTVDTVAALQAQYPAAEIYWLIGADMLPSLDVWHDPARLLRITKFIVAGRPTYGDLPACAQRWREAYGADITLADIEGPDISSTELRNRLYAGKPIEGMTPESVIRYIYENALYVPAGISALQLRLQGALGEARYAHTMGVVRCAATLADSFGVDAEQARLAALLHDCAKLPQGGTQALAARYGLRMEGLDAPIRHAPVGAAHARAAYGVEDEAVLQAVARHTVCAAGMTALDKVIYLADKMEPGRDYVGVEDIRRAAQNGLDAGMLACLAHTKAHLDKKGKPMHPATMQAWEEIQKNIKQRG
ncbi:MAG: nicotinate-nucleotide adenylyltransferase [Christensenellaceae bacterium]|jgi:nicotinate-nucleotide adenylyltransferase|nr:nicotinate-nucleotide adenylyltransferase [Christensenellaceae bacterium]